jgi:hypothetical protein
MHAPSRNRCARLLVLCFILLATSCQDLSDIVAVQKALAKEYDEPMHLSLAQGQLTLTLQNSRAGELDSLRQRAVARRIARLARQNHPRPDRLRRVTVNFTSVSRTGPLTMTYPKGQYSWAAAELADSVQSP